VSSSSEVAVFGERYLQLEHEGIDLVCQLHHNAEQQV